MTSQKIYPYHDKLFGCRIRNLTTSLRYSQQHQILSTKQNLVSTKCTHIHSYIHTYNLRNILFLASSPLFSFLYASEHNLQQVEKMFIGVFWLILTHCLVDILLPQKFIE